MDHHGRSKLFRFGWRSGHVYVHTYICWYIAQISSQTPPRYSRPLRSSPFAKRPSVAHTPPSSSPRSIMPAISLTAATGFLASSLALRATNTTGGANYCTYGQPCWPSLDSWSALNSTLDGNLFAVLPPASPCHTAHYDAGACATVREKWSDAYWRLDQIGAFENANWEDGQTPEEQCFYNNDASAPCGQGMVPPMMAEVHSVSDVQNSIAFALKNRLRFRIKGVSPAHHSCFKLFDRMESDL